jgi:hypothetical protein
MSGAFSLPLAEGLHLGLGGFSNPYGDPNPITTGFWGQGKKEFASLGFSLKKQAVIFLPLSSGFG